MPQSRSGRFFGLASIFFALFSVFTTPATAQQGESYHDLLTAQVQSDKLPAPEHLKNYVLDGKLRLSLRDAVVLTLENNSLVRVQETGVESAKFTLLGAHAPFDPLLTGSYNFNTASFPPDSTLQGVGFGAFNSTTQVASLNYSETFETGTNVQVGVNSNNSFSNNSFFLFNPAISSALNFQLTQPLLKNGWFFANRAPLIIARRNLDE
jgi:outer membrane protein TolC